MFNNPKGDFQRVSHHWSIDSVQCPHWISFSLFFSKCFSRNPWCGVIITKHLLSKANNWNPLNITLLFDLMQLSHICSHSHVLCLNLHNAIPVISFFSSLLLCVRDFFVICVLHVSAGSWEAVAGWRGRVDSTVLSSTPQRHEHGLLSPPAWHRGDAVAPQVWSPSPETTGPLGGRGRGGLAHPQPLHAPTVRGWICLLRSRAGNLGVNTKKKTQTLKLCQCESPGLKCREHPTMCD